MVSMELEKCLNETQIRNLIVQERYYRDNCMWEEMRGSYHPDSTKTDIKITWFHGNADDFVEGSKRMAAGGSRSVHNISPALVRMNADRALAESVGSILVRFDHKGAEYDLTSYTRFISRLQRVDSQWKLLTLEALYEKDTIVPVLPKSNCLDFAPPENIRESYKCLSWLLSQNGFTIDPSLPGADRPGSSETVIGEGVRWMNEELEETK